MNHSIDVDDRTFAAVDLAARLMGVTHGAVVARLVDESAKSEPVTRSADSDGAGLVPVYADYDGARTHGTFDPLTTRIDITSGPLQGQHFKSPSSAARAVVTNARPAVNANRNGWSFWVVDDGEGHFLQSRRAEWSRARHGRDR